MDSSSSIYEFIMNSGSVDSVAKYVESKNSDFPFLNHYLEQFVRKGMEENLSDRDLKVIFSLLNFGGDPMVSCTIDGNSYSIVDLVLKINDINLFNISLPFLTIPEVSNLEPFDLHPAPNFRNTLLHLVVTKPCVEVTRYILNLGVDVEVTNDHLETPLFYAFRYNQIEQAILLLQYGADFRRSNIDGDNILHITCYEAESHLEMAEFLLDVGCDPNSYGRLGSTPLQVLALLTMHRKTPNLKFAELLVKKGADTNLQGYGGYTPLHTLAVAYCDGLYFIPFFDILLNGGADTDIRDNKGRTCFDSLVDCENKRQRILKRFILFKFSRNFELSDRPISNISVDRLYEEKCRKELEMFKSRRIFDLECPLLEIFCMNETRLSRICNNEHLMSVMSEINECDFAIYGPDLKSKFMEAMTMYFEVEKGLEFLRLASNQRLDYYSMMRIIKFIPREDLRSMGISISPATKNMKRKRSKDDETLENLKKPRNVENETKK